MTGAFYGVQILLSDNKNTCTIIKTECVVCVCVCVCLCVRGNKKSIENLLVNVVKCC